MTSASRSQPSLFRGSVRAACLPAAAAACLLCVPAAAGAQIPHDEYLRYVPLKYPRIVRQTEASARFSLYGDPADPGYRDESPRDGVDDARGRHLIALSARFAPIMVRNTGLVPMDFRAFYDRDSFPLTLDRWDISRATFSHVDTSTVDLSRVGREPCTAADDASADCRLLDLVERYGPGRASLEPEAAAHAERELFSTMYVDFPGYDEETWKAAFEQEIRPTLDRTARVFAHPFVAEIPARDDVAAGFEFVIQYWFFYPYNDGPNNHEGDWEHINVVVSPRSGVTRALTGDEVRRLLSGDMPLDGDDPLVLRRVEYYVHHYVIPLDFATPNAYLPKAEWEREVESLAKDGRTTRKVSARVRERAWRDEAETAINTRPIVWIGGDAIGIQNVLQMPGLKDRDGHASYPFRGYYKRIGPGAVSERAIRAFEPQAHFADANAGAGAIVDYADESRIALTPDWERVADLVRSDPSVRREWAWLLLPMRFGYPASQSPVAGFVAHSDMGNVSVVGPSFNDGWNRIGDSAGYASYELKESSWAAPLSPADSMFPRVGFLNAPILYFMIKPPLDLAWRTVALPVRATVGTRQPTFLPASAPAVRSVSVEVGPMLTDLNDDFVTLFFSREQFPEIFTRIVLELLAGGATGDIQLKGRFTWVAAPAYGLTFHLTPHFSAESTVVAYKATIGFDVNADGLAHPIETRGDLHQFDYHGTLRYNFRTSGVQPYVKYGQGITWYRLKNVRVDGALLEHPDSPKYRPSSSWRALGFNETLLGGGVDWPRFKIGRAWMGAKASYTWIHHGIGFERIADVEDFPQFATELAGRTYSVWRQQARVLFTLGF